MVGRPTNSSPRAVACRRSRRQKAQCVVLLLARPYRGDRRGGVSTCPLACFSGDGRWTSSQPVTAPPVPQSPCCAACTQPQAESAPMHGGLLVARPCAGDRRGVVALLFGCGSGDSRRVRRRHDGRRRKSHHLLREERQRPPLFSPRHTHTRCTAPSSTTDRRLLARRAAPCRRVVLHTPRREQEESVDDVGDGDRLDGSVDG